MKYISKLHLFLTTLYGYIAMKRFEIRLVQVVDNHFQVWTSQQATVLRCIMNRRVRSHLRSGIQVYHHQDLIYALD